MPDKSGGCTIARATARETLDWADDLRLAPNTLTTDNARIHYTRKGGRRPQLIVLHGRTGDGLTSTRLARRLAPHFDVVMPDCRGHGRSSAPASGWGIATLTQDIWG